MDRIAERLVGCIDGLTEAARAAGRNASAAAACSPDRHGACRRRAPADAAVRPAGGTAPRTRRKRPTRMRILALLRARRLPLHLLRRHAQPCPPRLGPPRSPGSAPARIPSDNKDYLISYNDCCGTPLRPLPVQLQSGRTARLPHGRPQRHQLVHGEYATIYHCTVAAVIGLGQSGG